MVGYNCDKTREPRECVRGGNGTVIFDHLISKEQMLGKARLCAEITCEPGCSIGDHPHGPDAEIYYILEGEFVVSDNGEEKIMHVGDAMFIGGGEHHSVLNRSDRTAKLLAIVIC